MKELRSVLVSAIAPILWGTTYLVTTEVLPPNRPLLAAVLRALPAGLVILVLLGLRLGRDAFPRGAWWWRSAVLGQLNIGVFFALLFVAAYRLPGGVAAVLGALGPFVVAGLAFWLLHQRPSGRTLLAAGIGVLGVGLLVLRSATTLDPVGLAAAAGGMAVMSLGTVLGKGWGLPPGPDRPTTALLALTGWQLTAGGLALAPVAWLIEGPPPSLSATHLLGYGYLSGFGTALAYFLWFRALTQMAPARATVLVLLSPVVAAGLGWLVLDQTLTPWQLLGAVSVLGAVALAATAGGSERTGQRRTGQRRPVGRDNASRISRSTSSG